MNAAMQCEKYPRYTVEEYFGWKGDWELWNGIAIAMTPSPFGKHQRIVTRISHCIMNAIESAAPGCGECEVFVELDWIVDTETVVRPDVVVVCGEPVNGHLNRAPVVAVEVQSPSTGMNDRNFKFKLYEQQAVASYILIDPDKRLLECFQLLDGVYQQVSSGVNQQIKLTLNQSCELQIDTSRIFG